MKTRIALVALALSVASTVQADEKSNGVPSGWVSGRLTEITEVGDGLNIIFNRGLSHGVLPGDKGFLVSKSGKSVGAFEIFQVTRTESTGSTSLTVDQAEATSRVAALDSHHVCTVATANAKVTDANAAPSGYAFASVTRVTPIESSSGLTDYHFRIDKGSAGGVLPGAKIYVTLGSTALMAPLGYGEVISARKHDATAVLTAAKGMDNQIRRAAVAISSCK